MSLRKRPNAAVIGKFARAAVTDAPDGTRWVGLSEIRAEDYHAAGLECERLLGLGSAAAAQPTATCKSATATP